MEVKKNLNGEYKMNKPAILLLDFINEITHSDGKLSGPFLEYIEKNNVIENANHLIQYGRQNNIPIIFVKLGFNEGYPELSNQSPLLSSAKQFGALQLGTWATELNSKIDYQYDDIVIIKNRVSAFHGTNLEVILKCLQITDLLICGVSTNMAVELTARESHDRDYKVSIIADACGTINEELQRQSLAILSILGEITRTTDLN